MGYKLFIDHSVVDFPERSPRFQAFYIVYNVFVCQYLELWIMFCLSLLMMSFLEAFE